MKVHVAALTVLCLALTSTSAWAGFTLYENGPVNGNTDAWTFNFGYIVSDTFTFENNFPVDGFSIYVWELPGDSLTSVDWSITSGENSGTTYGHGTASMVQIGDCSTNQFGYNVCLEGTNGALGAQLNGAGTYWLNLQNAVVPSGDPIYWDENSGAGCRSRGCPSQASESAVGTIPSEAFTVTGSVPEPSIILMFGSSTLCLVGIRRWKRRSRA